MVTSRRLNRTIAVFNTFVSNNVEYIRNMLSPSSFEEPVELPKGDLVLRRDDFVLKPSTGPSLQVQRLYQSSRKDQLSVFGYGWLFPYDHMLQLYANFNMAETTGDGSQINYTYHKDNPDTMVDSFDGDSNIYYPLDQGHYTTDGGATTTLKRVSKDDYRVTQPDGTIDSFDGYKTSWQDPQQSERGKLTEIIDPQGNTLKVGYDPRDMSIP